LLATRGICAPSDYSAQSQQQDQHFERLGHGASIEAQTGHLRRLTAQSVVRDFCHRCTSAFS